MISKIRGDLSPDKKMFIVKNIGFSHFSREPWVIVKISQTKVIYHAIVHNCFLIFFLRITIREFTISKFEKKKRILHNMHTLWHHLWVGVLGAFCIWLNIGARLTLIIGTYCWSRWYHSGKRELQPSHSTDQFNLFLKTRVDSAFITRSSTQWARA